MHHKTCTFDDSSLVPCGETKALSFARKKSALFVELPSQSDVFPLHFDMHACQLGQWKKLLNRETKALFWFISKVGTHTCDRELSFICSDDIWWLYLCSLGMTSSFYHVADFPSKGLSLLHTLHEVGLLIFFIYGFQKTKESVFFNLNHDLQLK